MNKNKILYIGANQLNKPITYMPYMTVCSGNKKQYFEAVQTNWTKSISVIKGDFTLIYNNFIRQIDFYKEEIKNNSDHVVEQIGLKSFLRSEKLKFTKFKKIKHYIVEELEENKLYAFYEYDLNTKTISKQLFKASFISWNDRTGLKLKKLKN